MREIDLQTPMGAIFSDDRRFRYVLWRVWNMNKPVILQIGLNPSDANEIKNDPTVVRGMVRANRNGFGGFLMGNLYAYISTNPEVLLGNGDFVGELTDYYISIMVSISERQLCGWGSFPPVAKRASAVLAMIKEPYCLGTNSDGQPRHPLYVAYSVPMVKYILRRER